MKNKLLAVIVLLFFPWNTLLACTTFCLETADGPVFGKNYDWVTGAGMVYLNQSGLIKKSLIDSKYNPAVWNSKYGSVTFNQYGKDFPSGGMNERGLVVELMWLDDVKYPVNNNPKLGVLEWIQYQLDVSATIDEVISNAAKVTIASQTPLHYLVCDSTGDCITVEYLEGKPAFHRGDQLQVKVLTNDRYDKSVDYLKQHSGFGGSRKLASSVSSLDRFVRAAAMTREFSNSEKKDPVKYAFSILDSVRQPKNTKWSIVYQAKAGKVYFRTSANRRIKEIDFARLEFDCGKNVKMWNIDFDHEGDITDQASDYRAESNRQAIAKAYAATDFLKELPESEIDRIARHPDTATCSR